MAAHAQATAVAAPERRRSRAIAAALVLIALLVLAEHRTFAELWHVWRTNDNYSHGPLVPIASAALIWRRRHALRALDMRPSAWGPLIVALACAMQVLGVRSDVFAFQGYALPVLAAGLALTFLGPAVTRALAFPIGFLIFMLPFPPVVVNQMSYVLKEITVRLSTTLAGWLGVTLQRSGMTLFLSTGELRMENPCSGMRSLVSLLATGTLFAHLQPGGRLRRLAILSFAIPIAMLGNTARTTLLIVVAHYDSVAAAGGWIHDVSGLVVYAVALVVLLGLRGALAPRGESA